MSELTASELRRMVEVVWEDSTTIHGWHDEPGHEAQEYVLHDCRSVGYVLEDNERGIALSLSHDDSPQSASPWHCTIGIPRSAIREVNELSLVPNDATKPLAEGRYA